MNYDKAVLMELQKKKLNFCKIETEFKETKATNIGEVKGYANKL